MTAKATEKAGLEKLREPFAPNLISKLPKQSKAQSDQVRADRNQGVNCKICDGWHHKNAVHLDYVGHAAATDRLLDTDIEWTWEPLAVDQQGLPAFDKNGGLWIKLTVCGVTRLGYGSADGKTGGDAIKEIIGDAIRNSGMRFGMALDLWHKGDLHVEAKDDDAVEEKPANKGRSCDDEAMIAWVDEHKAKFEKMDGAPSLYAYESLLNDPDFIRDMKAVHKANPGLFAELKRAKDAAGVRVNDTPF